MDLPITTEHVLGQPTRARLFELLEAAARPMPTAELADRLEMHPNGVRNHLERMSEAGLIVRRRAAGSRGRPRDQWVISPTALPAGVAPTAYSDLVRWLARAYPTSEENLRQIEEVGREAGRETGRRSAPAAEAEVPEALAVTLTALGFQPELTDQSADGFTCVLGNCPYREAVHENQPIVCGLHHGLTGGLLESFGSGFRLDEFTPKDPDEAGCVIGVVRSGDPG